MALYHAIHPLQTLDHVGVYTTRSMIVTLHPNNYTDSRQTRLFRKYPGTRVSWNSKIRYYKNPLKVHIFLPLQSSSDPYKLRPYDLF